MLDGCRCRVRTVFLQVSRARVRRVRRRRHRRADAGPDARLSPAGSDTWTTCGHDRAWQDRNGPRTVSRSHSLLTSATLQVPWSSGNMPH